MHQCFHSPPKLLDPRNRVRSWKYYCAGILQHYFYHFYTTPYYLPIILHPPALLQCSHQLFSNYTPFEPQFESQRTAHKSITKEKFNMVSFSCEVRLRSLFIPTRFETPTQPLSRQRVELTLGPSIRAAATSSQRRNSILIVINVTAHHSPVSIVWYISREQNTAPTPCVTLPAIVT